MVGLVLGGWGATIFGRRVCHADNPRYKICSRARGTSGGMNLARSSAVEWDGLSAISTSIDVNRFDRWL